MNEKCIGNCLICGKCGSSAILDSFSLNKQSLNPREGFGIAVDIGTTTVVLALADLSTGEIYARHSFMNPQREFGPDVISRISAANEGKLENLRSAITGIIAEGVETILESRGIAPEQVRDMVIAGNTTMVYLLLGFPCRSLGVFPFKPAYTAAESYGFSEIFGSELLRCSVRIIPFLSAFVGGDITAGLLHVFQGSCKRFVLIDLGTNGEMALCDNGMLTVTSTAAGPAFEGGGHGGGASGVIGDLAELVRGGFVDETGLLAENAPPLFTQKEIRDLQLAKSAVRSGLEILLERLGYDALEAVYLAGGIGQAMDVDCAVRIGLLPAELKDKVRAVGNASLGGAVYALLTQQDANKFYHGLTEINLSNHPKFNDYFMDYMYFED